MKQKILIFGLVLLTVAILAGLNAVSYTQKEKTPDNEFTPNRSTFSTGSTGTQAFYALLSETGRNVMRWQQPPSALLTTRSPPIVFVITGDLKRGFSDQDTEQLLRWVSEGGRLVLIDRNPPASLLKTTSDWEVSFGHDSESVLFGLDSSDPQQMTDGTAVIKPVQPTVVAAGVSGIQPSRLAATVNIDRQDKEGDRETPLSIAETGGDSGPVVHFGSADKNFVVEATFGGGRIFFLTDPYIVSNGGIALADNARLALNVVTAGDGLVAFDEYHQGYGDENNRFLEFFAGTPVVAIFSQAVLLVGFVFYSRSRRFARAVPEPEVSRLSKLEYVEALAELQDRTKAFDLAVENIYGEFRRRTSRLFGLGIKQATSKQLSVGISERTDLDRSHVEETLFKCEEIIRGEPTNKREVMRLVEGLRRIEHKLGIDRSVRAGDN